MWAAALAEYRITDKLALNVCIDVDMSYRPFGGLLHLGAHRSPCRSADDFITLHGVIKECKHVRLSGVMGYEAQISGLPDASPYGGAMNYVARIVKMLSVKDVFSKRKAIAKYLSDNSILVDLFNVGGSGSAALSASDSAATEITIGSGLLQSSIFDGFIANQCVPAFCFALTCTRSTDPGSTICCQSGGFIASGEVDSEFTMCRNVSL